jgi:hypothetical protein
VSNKSFNPDKRAISAIMGGTIFGDVDPIGFDEPITFNIDRAGFRRVRIGGPA